jgi:V-type H+-transporting ATPase subunit a
MSYFRSETMAYYQIVIPRESAWDVYNELGKIDTVHHH